MTPPKREPSPDPLLLAIDMGYGHLRAAWALADVLHVPVFRIDARPIGTDYDLRSWTRVRRIYEFLSQGYSHPHLGRVARRALDGLTRIPPLRPEHVHPTSTRAVRLQAKLIRKGMGAEIARRMREEGIRIVSTFYTPGLVADYAGLDHAYVVVTDADAHRVWAPMDPTKTRITYLAPSRRVVERLRSYGVPESRVSLTGFPLPLSLVGDESADVLRRNLERRVARLSADAGDAPPHLLLAIGGAGAQTQFVRAMLKQLRRRVEDDALRLTLVAGLRPHVAASFRQALRAARLDDHPGVRVLAEGSFEAYWKAFNETLSGVDVIWTKPSEMVFYAGLGIPLILAPPVGAHEQYNAQWVQGAGAALPQGPPAQADRWLPALLRDGTLARCAEQGYGRLPHDGTRAIAARVQGENA